MTTTLDSKINDKMNKNTIVYIFIGNILKKQPLYTMETKGNGSTNRT